MQTIEITDIQDFAVQLIGDKGPWVYRGQRESTWELEPSITRSLTESLPANVIHRIEKDLRHQFESTAIHYSSRADLPSSDFGWLSLMQHNGAPTRLLDFTESPFMALFFAFDGANANDSKYSSITAINYRELNQKSLGLMGKKLWNLVGTTEN